ncbi:hypothetical protein COLO4_34973 [Corchorus olitorius]|uniref:RRM domain-containing protein n=1 Tax=Corchorus olitorius TaxID=93759 RepID=A0A1R3GIP4_9ROSI|nr:hypothetical protein COLO4_34973 [Corchorus olitorius]
MTIDDGSSVYVGGLPYDATESNIRRIFSSYGDVIAVKIVNDQTTRGKCYGFVTFRNPRSAYDAINDMDGRKIGGRVVRVNEVNTRAGRSSFNRDRPRLSGWDRRQDRDRDHNRDREREQYWDPYSDRSTEHDRSRDHDAGIERGYKHHGHDRAEEYSLDRVHDRDMEYNLQGESRDQTQDWERGHEQNLDQNREIDGTNGYHGSVDMDKEQQFRRWNGSINNDQHSRGPSSDSSDDYRSMKLELELSIKNQEGLNNSIPLKERSLKEEEQRVLNLQKKSKTLEDALITAKKLSSKRKMQLTKSLVDSPMSEIEDDVAVHQMIKE